MTWADGPLLGLDLETTGPSPLTALPVSFALISFDRGEVGSVRYGLVNPGVPIPAEATEIHGITDDDVRARGGTLTDSLRGIVDRLLRAQQDGAPVVGFNVRYDLTVIDTCIRRDVVESDGFDVGLRDLGWEGAVVDAMVLDRHVDRYRKGSRKLAAVCRHYGVALKNAHSAAADAVGAVQCAQVIAQKYPEVGNATLDELTVLQGAWHNEWLRSYDEYRVSKGEAPLGPDEFGWPLAGEKVVAR